MKIHLLLLCALLSLAGTAQTVIFDFEDGAPAYTDFNGSATDIIENPDSTMLNPSDSVARNVIPADAAFAGVNFTQPVDITTDKGFSLLVWSPVTEVPVLLKLEVDPNNFEERQATFTGAPGSWQEIRFDFTGATLTSFNSVTLFFNFNQVAATENTYYWDNLIQDDVVAPQAPTTAAPTPTEPASEVISLFSDAYDDVPVNTFRADFGSSALLDTMIAGNNVKRYSQLDFVGIETLGDNALDLEAAGVTHVHFDYWTPNATTIRLKLVDFGGDGFGMDNDTEDEIERGTVLGTWTGVDIPLGGFNMNKSDVSQLIFSALPFGSSTVFLDNIYFYVGEDIGDQMTLPVTFDDPDVDYGLADFGGAASVLVADPTDATNTVVRTTKTAGAETFAGTTLTSVSGNPDGFAEAIPLTDDASIISVRVWSPTVGTPVRLKVENVDAPTISVETEVNTEVAMAWDTLFFDFKDEATGTAAINFDAVYDKLTIFFDFGTRPTVDTSYFWDDVIFTGTTGNGGMEEAVPMVAAPTPTRADSNVVSLFSDAYTDVAVDTWRTPWSVASFEDTEVAGNAVKKYTDLTFAGVELLANPLDLNALGMTHFHVDYWTPNMDTIRFKLVDFGGDGAATTENNTETEPVLMTTQGEWVSVDLELATDFAGMNFDDINQFIISGLPVGTGTVYLDNVYFYKMLPNSTTAPRVGVLEVFPNPVRELVKITAPTQMRQLQLFSASGQRVGVWQPRATTFDLDMTLLPRGVYVALVNSRDGLLTVKLIKE